MGLINWFKDKVILSLEHDLALLKARMEGFELNIEQLKAQIISVRQKAYRKKEEFESDTDQVAKDLEEVRRAFGGDLPIELREKYNNYGNIKE